jgi:prefoldin subunit 5
MYENIYEGFLKIKKDIEEISSHQEDINNPLQYLYYRSQQLQEEYNQLVSKYGGAYEKEENYT